MEPTKPRLPREVIELYNDFIHGEISRRAFMEGVQRLAGGMAAATVIRSIKGHLVRPISADTRSDAVTKLPGVIVVHENRGLNPRTSDWFNK